MELPLGELFSSKQSVTINGKTIILETKTGTFQLRDPTKISLKRKY